MALPDLCAHLFILICFPKETLLLEYKTSKILPSLENQALSYKVLDKHPHLYVTGKSAGQEVLTSPLAYLLNNPGKLLSISVSYMKRMFQSSLVSTGSKCSRLNQAKENSLKQDRKARVEGLETEAWRWGRNQTRHF